MLQVSLVFEAEAFCMSMENKVVRLRGDFDLL